MKELSARTLTAWLAMTLPLCCGPSPAEAAKLPEGEIFFELNDTDGDLGLHASIDGGPYEILEIIGPDGAPLLVLSAEGALAAQGMTQLMFESAEPSFDELEPAEFFERFPEGKYEIRAVDEAGKVLKAAAFLDHKLAEPPPDVTVSGQPAADDCDAEDLPVGVEPVLVDWEPVTQAHPELGDAGLVRVARYQVFVERGDVKLGIDLPPSVTELEVPTAITAGGGIFKLEIIARTEDDNNTAIETCFEVP